MVSAVPPAAAGQSKPAPLPPPFYFDANRSPVAFLTTEEAAAFLRLEPPTLEKLRKTGGGPPVSAPTRRVTYFIGDLLEWALAHRHASNAAKREGITIGGAA